MKWLEIIELRTGSTKDQQLPQAFRQLLKELTRGKNLPKVSIYNNCSLSSDYSILLYHDSSQPNIMGSVLGMQISTFLKDFGLVNHNIWIERSCVQENPTN